MKTLLTASIEAAAEIIRSGGLVAFPTETVYGLGANAFDDAAVRKIFAAKGRPADNPLIVHIADIKQIDELVLELNDQAKSFIAKFFPGALTIVARRSGKAAASATAGLSTVAFRMPANEIARELIERSGVPLVAPSANISGRPSPTTWQAVYEDLNGRIDCILKGEPTAIGLESTVVDCTGDVPRLLRPGAISLDELRSIVPSTQSSETHDGGEIRSPGLKHKHYSPKAKVVLIGTTEIDLDLKGAYIGINEPVNEFAFSKIVSDSSEYARVIFEFFRECDRRGIGLIYCEAVEPVGIGTALMDRIDRSRNSE
ncbi:MAG: L-threonylcarbamoyladenylate synthase [Pyrinomonadaceae bacterium]